MIDKADSIEEEKEESSERESFSHGSLHQKTTFSSDDIVIEEDLQVSSGSDEARERKKSIVDIATRKSFEVADSPMKQQPIEASHLPPTSISTQTVPTEEFPEAPVTTTAAVNQTAEAAQSNAETQQDTKIAQEIDSKTIETRKSCSRSINESLGDASADDTASSAAAKACDEEKQKQCLLAHQQSMSQEEDYEVAMVSGLLPGCVAPAPTPAPSIAPLAEIELDPTEDDAECENVEHKPEVERKKKRKERKEKEGGESQSQAQAEADGSTNPEKSKRNAVCPWEDE